MKTKTILNDSEARIKNTKELQKHFATVLRIRSKSDSYATDGIDESILKFFSRKELIQIIWKKFDGKLPKELDLIELENLDLLNLIKDDLVILSFLVEKWIAEEKSLKSESPDLKNKQETLPSKSNKLDNDSKRVVPIKPGSTSKASVDVKKDGNKK